MEAGAHYGYSRTRRHPTVTKFLFGTKNGSDIIDLEKVAPQIEKAAAFLSELGKAGKVVLFVGVKPEARAAIVDVAESLRMPMVTQRWIGGMLTNFGEIKRRVQRLEDIKADQVSGDILKYTKKEQLLIARELERLNKYFSGLVGMTRMPDAVVVVDSKKEHIAVLEAHKMNIPVIAIGNTDCSIARIEYPIIANDGSVSSIKAILDILKNAFQK